MYANQESPRLYCFIIRKAFTSHYLTAFTPHFTNMSYYLLSFNIINRDNAHLPDCDNDDQCVGDLICFQRTGDEFVPGCTNVPGFTTEDFCIPKPTNLLQNIGNEYTNGYYGECQGDCDSNSDCAGNLVCFQRTGKQTDRYTTTCTYSVFYFVCIRCVRICHLSISAQPLTYLVFFPLLSRV